MCGQEWYDTNHDLQSYHWLTINCVGEELYSKISGYDSLSADAAPLREDATFLLASATKLITSIALLQCVEKGRLSLDEPLTQLLPELDHKDIIKSDAEGRLIFEPCQQNVTARQLLSHTADMGYRTLHPLLVKWSTSAEAQSSKYSPFVVEKYNTPLVFEPGTGWQYGSSLDWAGVVVRRLHNNMSLEDYFIENIWKKVELCSPFPTFALSQHPDYNARLMEGGKSAENGLLKPWEPEQPRGDNTQDQEGGGGLVGTAKDYLAVLADLVSDAPKLLQPATIS